MELKTKLFIQLDCVPEKELLCSCVSNDVRVFEYNRYTTSEDEIKALITSDIESIAVVWNFHHSYVIPLFERTFSDYSVNELDEEGLGSLTFGDVTVKEGKQGYYSPGLLRIIADFKSKRGGNPVTLDFLSCELNTNGFIRETQVLEEEFGINVRQSLDKTGNMPEGNWILESDNVNIRDYQFTENIVNWHHTLASAISGSANISAIADGSGAVFSYDAGTKTYTLQRDITWDANLTGVSSTTDYLILTAGEVIDGNDKIIYTTANLYGFIATTVSGDSAFTNVPLVKNLTVKPTNGKWFSMFTKESQSGAMSNFTLTTKSNADTINTEGIAYGSRSTNFGVPSYFKATKCSVKANTSWGGWFSGEYGFTLGAHIIENCKFEGNITGRGGLFGFMTMPMYYAFPVGNKTQSLESAPDLSLCVTGVQLSGQIQNSECGMLGAHRFGWQGGRVMLSNGNHLSTATGNGVVMNKISVNTSISSGNSSNGLLFGPQMDYGTFCNIYVEGNLQPQCAGLAHSIWNSVTNEPVYFRNIILNVTDWDFYAPNNTTVQTNYVRNPNLLFNSNAKSNVYVDNVQTYTQHPWYGTHPTGTLAKSTIGALSNNGTATIQINGVDAKTRTTKNGGLYSGSESYLDNSNFNELMYSISGLRHDMTITDGVADISTSSNVVMDFANVWESGPSAENPIPIFRLFKDDVNWNSDQYSKAGDFAQFLLEVKPLYTLNSGNLVGTFNITLSPSIKSQTVAIASGRAYNKGIRSIKMDATPTGEANDLSIEFVADSNITTSTIDEDKGTGVNVTGLGMVVSATLSNYTDNKLSLTLTYTDDILSAVGVTDATSLKFFHYTGGQWESVTTTVNTSNKTITGEFTSLSPVDIGAEVRIGRFVQRTNNPVIIKGSGGITVRNTYG